MTEPRYVFPTDYFGAAREPRQRLCLDCGAIVGDTDAHDRFHAILNHHARALAVLTNSHPELRERIGRNRNNWSAEAFAEVTESVGPSDPESVYHSDESPSSPAAG